MSDTLRTSRSDHAESHTWLWIAVTVVLAAVPFAAGKAYELVTPDAFDSGAYVYSAQRVLDGARIGVDEQPTAQPGTLIVNMLGVWLVGFDQTGPKLVQTCFQIVALGFMFLTLRRLWGRLAAAVGVIVAATYLSAPVIAKVGNVKEQYMIACMVVGIACWIRHQLGGSWRWAVASGAALAWAPLFKQTGISAGVAVGVFVLAQPLLGHHSWRRMARDTLLLLVGALAGLAPVLAWMALAGAPLSYWPYASFVRAVLPSDGARFSSYVTESRRIMPPAALAPIVLRYYRVLSLPIVLAAASVVLGVSRWVRARWGRGEPATSAHDRFVLLLAVWWILDMAFVWVSPRSYEQYYLPLTASAAFLGAYSTALIHRRVSAAGKPTRWVAGATTVLLAALLSHHIVIGLSRSPFSGNAYDSRRRGYVQSVKEVAQRLESGPLHTWERASDAIRENTQPSDHIYVWGWYPGIYVSAQRFSPTPKACEGSMHTLAPDVLATRVGEILSAFERTPPEVIVDSRKRHFPWNRPPLELWPRTREGYLTPMRYALDAYDASYTPWLEEKFGRDEALRYEAMRPLREYVMRNYVVAAEHGPHVVFRRRHESSPGAPSGPSSG